MKLTEITQEHLNSEITNKAKFCEIMNYNFNVLKEQQDNVIEVLKKENKNLKKELSELKA